MEKPLNMVTKHELVSCDRCGSEMECKANNSLRCDCTTIPISKDEAEYIGEYYESCLCKSCLNEMKQAFLGKEYKHK